MEGEWKGLENKFPVLDSVALAQPFEGFHQCPVWLVLLRCHIPTQACDWPTTTAAIRCAL